MTPRYVLLQEIAEIHPSPASRNPEPDELVRAMLGGVSLLSPGTVESTGLVPFHLLPAWAVAVAPGDLCLPRKPPGSVLDSVTVALTEGYAINSVIVVRPHPGVAMPGNAPLWKWLQYFLAQSYGRLYENENDGRSWLNLDRLGHLRVPLPESIAESLPILDEAVELLRLRQEADTARLPILGSLFTERVGETAAIWESPERRLGEVALVRIGSGLPKSMTHYFGGSIPFVGEEALFDRDITASAETLTAAGLKATGAPLVDAGTILLGTRDTALGWTGRLRFAAAINDAVAAITVRNPAYPPEWLWVWLQQSEAYIAQMVQTAAVPGLTSDLIRSIPIPVASESVYQEIAQAVAQLDALGTAAEKQWRTLSSMFSALLDWAMSERLTTGDAASLGRLPSSRKRTDRLANVALSDLKRRPIWSRLSKAQQSVTGACLSFPGPFSVDDLKGAVGDGPDREKLMHTLDLLVTMGVLIKDGRPEVDRWRRPHLEFDREVQV